MAELLPTGTVTLLLADVEGSTHLWQTQRDAMTSAIARMNHAASHLVAEHNGVRPVEQGEGDSFVIASRSSLRSPWAQGAIAPPRIDFDSSGTISRGSKS